MIKLFLASILVIISVIPAYAQNDLALCRLRAQHMARADVAYQPGVDVHGNPVVQADVNAAPSMVHDVIRIPLNVDLAQRLASVPSGVELEADMGMVEVYKDGRVTFNGQDLTNVAAVVCGDQVAASAEATAPPEKIIVPADAPAVPMATAKAPAAPVIPSDAVASPPLPPQTLGQFRVPAKQSVAAPVAPASAKSPVVQAPPQGERTNADLAKEDEIIWGEGN